MKHGKFMVASAMALCLTGCYNMRTDVNQSIEECTFGESCEHYLLFAHDCRRSPEECNPFCCKDIEKFEENKVLNEANWDRFKNFNPEKYRFNPSGIIVLDKANEMLLNLAFQIKHEIVVPYIELDKEGLISTYYLFMEDIEVYRKAYKETYEKELDLQTACVRVFKDWQRKYGEYNCNRLLASFPVIESLSVNQQLLNALKRNCIPAAELVLLWKDGVAQLSHESKSIWGIIRISIAGLQATVIAEELAWTTSYLAVHEGEKLEMASHVKEYLNQIQTGVL